MYKYDFGLSFAGEERAIAVDLANRLKAERVRVFYDRDQEAELWGKDLYQKFQEIYGMECRYFIPIISANYIAHRWPQHELKQAQAREFKSDTEYILPLRVDDSDLPGLNDTVAYLDLRTRSIAEVAILCMRKLVADDPVRRLYMFLRDKNPESLQAFHAKPDKLVIRVALGTATQLSQLLQQVGQHICTGIDMQNTLMNGGFGPTSVVPSTDGEPHTTFLLSFTPTFYQHIEA